MRNFHLIFSTVIFFLLISCNSKPEKSKNVKVENDNTEERIESIKPQESVESSKNQLAKSSQNSLKLNETIFFEDVDWYNPRKKEISVFKGINTTLIRQIIIDYVHEHHLDPNRKEVEPVDSVTLDIIARTFTYYRKTTSKYSYGDSYDNPYGEDDEESEKYYDYIMVSGVFNFLNSTSDSLNLNLSGEIGTLDAYTIYMYGETSPRSTDSFKYGISVDLMEKMNNLGFLYKFTKNDLEIVTEEGLAYIRNQFYARKGRIFKTRKMKKYFEPKEWYKPLYDDVTEKLSEIELYNIHFIKDLEDDKK
ncbi:MAG: YARHG domain-containing protein [Bacteroidales bacterium]|nr:YARHG domain-containing protein [Bacteroidales bacterium]